MVEPCSADGADMHDDDADDSEEDDEELQVTGRVVAVTKPSKRKSKGKKKNGSTVSSTMTSEMRHEAEVKKRIIEWVKNTAFSYTKFLHKPDLYAANSMYFLECMKDTYMGYGKMDEENKKYVWEEYGRFAKDKLCNRRHNVVKAMKEKYRKMIEDSNKLINERSVKVMLLGPWAAVAETDDHKSSEETYREMLKEFLPCVIGETAWKAKRASKLLSDYTTPSDEGFILVSLENFFPTWKDVILHDKIDKSVWNRRNKKREANKQELLPDSKIATRPRYSDGGSGATDQGWSEEGMIRFNELCANARKWRQDVPKWTRLQTSIQTAYKVQELELLAVAPKRKADTMPDSYNDWDMKIQRTDCDDDENNNECNDEEEEDDNNVVGIDSNGHQVFYDVNESDPIDEASRVTPV